MKNKLIYLISVLFVAVACFSCSDDDDDNNDKDLIGTWNYTKKTSDIHFKFEYNGDEISFPEGLIPSGAVPLILSSAELPAEQQAMIKTFVETFSSNLKTFEFGAKLSK